MELTEKANGLRREMNEVVFLRWECTAVERDYQRLLRQALDGEDVDYGLLGFLERERRAYRKALAHHRAKNWARLSRAAVSDPFVRRLFTLRYAMGYSWRVIAQMTGRPRQEILAAHDAALNVMAEEVTV